MKHVVIFLLSSMAMSTAYGMDTIDTNGLPYVYRVYSRYLEKSCTIFSEIRLDQLESKPHAYSYQAHKAPFSMGKDIYDIVFYDENSQKIGSIYYHSKNINKIEKLCGFPLDLSHIERKKRKCVVQ